MSRHPLAAGAAPGKVILFGEHSVVYGQPAIAAALGHGLGATVSSDHTGPWLHIPRWGASGLTVRPSEPHKGDAMCRAFGLALRAVGLELSAELAVTIDGELPLGVGLGSSAAFAVALLRGLADYASCRLVDADLLQAAGDIEAIFHGNPSGLDHTVVATGQCLHFVHDTVPSFTPIELGCALPLVISWTPRRGTTKEAVAHLNARHGAYPGEYDRLFQSMGDLAQRGADALRVGDLDYIGHLFDLNHGFLNACGVSDPTNETMVNVARSAGALGAKLTGAGRGGATIALCPHEPEAVVLRLREAGYLALFTEVA